MARVTLDPDDVNQDRVVTVLNGDIVDLGTASRAQLDAIARQLHVFRSAYAHAIADPDVGDRIVAGHLQIEAHSPLYLRVQQLQTAAREGHRRPTSQLDVHQLLQDTTWTSSSGVTRRVTALTPTHRANLRAYLARTSDDLERRATAELTETELAQVHHADPWVAGTPFVRRLDALIAAESPVDRARDTARQVVRAIEFERSGDWPER